MVDQINKLQKVVDEDKILSKVFLTGFEWPLNKFRLISVKISR